MAGGVLCPHAWRPTRAERLREQREAAQGEAEALRGELAALRGQKDDAQREFDYVMEQAQLDLDDEEATGKMQMERLMRDHVEGLNAQLHVYTRYAIRALR